MAVAGAIKEYCTFVLETYQKADSAKEPINTDKDEDEKLTYLSNNIVKVIEGRAYNILACVEALNCLLTSCDHQIRAKGVKFLATIITKLPTTILTLEEINVLSEFMQSRVSDHQSMEAAALSCIKYFVSCQIENNQYVTTILNYFKTKLHVAKMHHSSRFMIFEILESIVIKKKESSGGYINSDLVYSVLHLLEGESNPKNLILAYRIVEFMLKNFKNLEPYIEDFFEWFSSYYPIEYSPSEEDLTNANITRDDLVKALYDCFFASSLNVKFLQALMIEKLESSVTQTKIESLQCLQRCYLDKNSPSSSISDYATSIWVCIRMDCLKKTNLVDAKLLSTYLETLSLLSKRLAEDEDKHYMFCKDICEEFSIAFNNLDLELFDPALRLVGHASIGLTKTMNMVLSTILPITIKSLSCGELRVVPGIHYILSLFLNEFKDTSDKSYIHEDNRKLLSSLIELLAQFSCKDQTCLDLMEILMLKKLGIPEDLRILINQKLREAYVNENVTVDVENCLVVLLNYPEKSSTTHIQEILSIKDDSSASDVSLCLRKISYFANQPNSNSQLEATSEEDVKKLLKFLCKSSLKYRAFAKLNQNIYDCCYILVNRISAQKLDPILLAYFQSVFCQSLLSQADAQDKIILLELMAHIWKALVVRNHKFAAPLTNLLLNALTSDNSDEKFSHAIVKTYEFVQNQSSKTKINPYDTERGYNVFALYKQKIFLQSMKEILLRYEKETREDKKQLLVLSAVVQLQHLSFSAYKTNLDWLMQQILTTLSSFKSELQNDEPKSEQYSINDDILLAILNGLNCLISEVAAVNFLESHVYSFIEYYMCFAKHAPKLHIRCASLKGLEKVCSVFDEKILMPHRQRVSFDLKICLKDKKRLVRTAAAEARNKWILLGQPIG